MFCTPEGFLTLTSALIVKNAQATIDSYKKALGAKELGAIKLLVYAMIITLAPFFAGSASAQTALAKPTLWGIYGTHDVHACPINNRETAKKVSAVGARDLRPLMEKYGVTSIVSQYHSSLEHTFLWAVETKEPHNLEEFSIELGIARFNKLTFVPLRTFEEVVPYIRRLHGLDKPKNPSKN